MSSHVSLTLGQNLSREQMISCRAQRIKWSKQTTGTESSLDHQEAAIRGLCDGMRPPIQLLAATQNSHNGIPAQGTWVSDNVMAPQARKCWNRQKSQEMSFWKSWGSTYHGKGWHRVKDTSYQFWKLFLESPAWPICLLRDFHYLNPSTVSLIALFTMPCLQACKNLQYYSVA